MRISASNVSSRVGTVLLLGPALAFAAGPSILWGLFQPGRSCPTRRTKRPYKAASIMGAAGPLARSIAACPSSDAATLNQSRSGL
jgi:hypothetical protein